MLFIIADISVLSPVNISYQKTCKVFTEMLAPVRNGNVLYLNFLLPFFSWLVPKII